MAQAATNTASAKSHLHVLPLKVYLAVGTALLVFTLLTTEIAQIDFGEMNIIIAMAIATVKALLVALFFMHLWWDNKLFFIAFSIGLITLSVFIALTMVDTMDRGQINPETDGQINPRAEMYSAPGFGSGHHGEGEGVVHDSTAADSSGAHSGSAADSMATGDSASAESGAHSTDESESSH